MRIIKKYEIIENENVYIVKEYDNGFIEKILNQNIVEEMPIEQPTPQPTLEDKINFLYYKQIGVI